MVSPCRRSCTALLALRIFCAVAVCEQPLTSGTIGELTAGLSVSLLLVPAQVVQHVLCGRAARPMKGRKSPGGGLFDRLLVPRIENYGQNHDITDSEAVVEYLRRNYKEYQRQKVPALRQQVERAVETIARKGGVTKAELRLQVGGEGGWPAGCSSSDTSVDVDFKRVTNALAGCTGAPSLVLLAASAAHFMPPA